MVTLQYISYTPFGGTTLFDNIHFSLNKGEKVALLGNNGVGKSTLLKIIANQLEPTSGERYIEGNLYYIPQIYGQFNDWTIAQALEVDKKITALSEILKGTTDEKYYNWLDNDWNIEERCNEALAYWGLQYLNLNTRLGELSGGEKTKVFLAGILIHSPQIILLDEPSNHLDGYSRELLYNFIQTTNSSLLVVSHDRKLLNLLPNICELTSSGLEVYGGNYDFYKEQKHIGLNALQKDIQHKQKELRKAKLKEKETLQRQQKLDTRGKEKMQKSGVARIMMNTLRNKAENSTSKLKGIHAERIDGISQKLHELQSVFPLQDRIKLGFDVSELHKGKILFSATEINFRYQDKPLWKESLSFQIVSGERIAIKGKNGSGKTTLINLLLGNLKPFTGQLQRADTTSLYIDQDYSLLKNNLTVFQQAQAYNSSALQEHEIKSRLSRFLFSKEKWDTNTELLSGGEKMRLLLCCLSIRTVAPDIIILDEPTNNLDIQNLDILSSALKHYNGTLLVISHDETFLQTIHVNRIISL
jgi:ATPase subunit of ABC transporter with duplicated ATPase domains